MGKRHRLAELQLAIMQVLWNRGEATVAQVREDLSPARSLAHTTVGTMLTKLEQKGHVSHRIEGRSNVYRPVLKQADVSQTMVLDLADRLFGGDTKRMVCHLLDDEELTVDDLAELRRMIRRREKELDQ